MIKTTSQIKNKSDSVFYVDGKSDSTMIKKLIKKFIGDAEVKEKDNAVPFYIEKYIRHKLDNLNENTEFNRLTLVLTCYQEALANHLKSRDVLKIQIYDCSSRSKIHHLHVMLDRQNALIDVLAAKVEFHGNEIKNTIN